MQKVPLLEKQERLLTLIHPSVSAARFWVTERLRPWSTLPYLFFPVQIHDSLQPVADTNVYWTILVNYMLLRGRFEVLFSVAPPFPDAFRFIPAGCSISADSVIE